MSRNIIFVTPRSRAPHEELIDVYIVNKFLAFYGT
jgi:hypothetical protein